MLFIILIVIKDEKRKIPEPFVSSAQSYRVSKLIKIF